MRKVRSKPWRRCYGYVIRVRPRPDGLPCIVEVNPAAQTVSIVKGAGAAPVVTRALYEKLIALAEQLCQEQAAIVFRLWPHLEFDELIELYRAPSAGWQAPVKQETEPF